MDGKRKNCGYSSSGSFEVDSLRGPEPDALILLTFVLRRGRHLVFVRQPPPLLCENALSTSELYDKVPPTMPPTSAGTAAAAAAVGSSSAASDSQGGSGGSSASFDHGHPGWNSVQLHCHRWENNLQ